MTAVGTATGVASADGERVTILRAPLLVPSPQGQRRCVTHLGRVQGARALRFVRTHGAPQAHVGSRGAGSGSLSAGRDRVLTPPAGDVLWETDHNNVTNCKIIGMDTSRYQADASTYEISNTPLRNALKELDQERCSSFWCCRC